MKPTVEELIKAATTTEIHPAFDRWHPEAQRKFMEVVHKNLPDKPVALNAADALHAVGFDTADPEVQAAIVAAERRQAVRPVTEQERRPVLIERAKWVLNGGEQPEWQWDVREVDVAASFLAMAEELGDQLNAMAEIMDGFTKAQALVGELSKPIDMLLFCPNCTEQHIDAPHGDWTNPPHKTHECQRCNYQWRPCDRPTNGVAELKTKGKYDSPAQPRPYPPGFGG